MPTKSKPAFSCPLCGGAECKDRLRLHDRTFRTTPKPFRLVACASCGLLRLHPAPDSETLKRAYAAHYAPYSRPGLSGKLKTVLERLSVKRLWSYFEPPRKILDVGCASGDLLVAIRDAGNDNVAGIEPDPGTAETARKRGVCVFTGTIEHARLESESWNTVIASHTLEHVQDPVDVLAEIRRILAPGGTLLLRLPNADSFEARMLGKYWIGYDAPRHLTTFTVATISRALELSGFRVADVHYEWIGLEWAWGVRLFVRARWPAIERLLGLAHPFMIMLSTPIAIASAVRNQSGRIRVIAVKD